MVVFTGAGWVGVVRGVYCRLLYSVLSMKLIFS